MNAKTLVVAALALVGAIVAFMMVRSFLDSAQQSAVQEAKPVEITSQILVTARPLPTGSILKLEDLVWMQWPAQAIAEPHIVEGRGNIEDHVGKVVRLSFGDREPFNTSKVVTRGERGFIAAILNPNMRAITVAVNAQSGVAGLALPGDRVDIILTHTVKDPNGMPHSVSETVLQNVRLLSVDQRSADNETVAKPGKTITLEVTPKMVEKVAMLIKLGTLSMSLRALPRDGDALANDLDTPPTDAMRSLTWDNEVSQLLQPNKGKKQIVIMRGDKAAAQDFTDNPKEKAQ